MGAKAHLWFASAQTYSIAAYHTEKHVTTYGH